MALDILLRNAGVDLVDGLQATVAEHNPVSITRRDTTS